MADMHKQEPVLTQKGSMEAPDDVNANEAEQSLQHTEFEHGLGFWQAVKLYRPAVLWCLLVNLAVVLSGFDGALIGSLVGIESFTKQFGFLYEGEYIVNAAWLGALNYAALVGAAIGSLFAGICYDILGPRITLGICCLGSIGSIFLQFFSSTVEVLFVGELFNGVIIGFYPVIASAYIGEVCPVVLRGVIGSAVNLSFVIGQLVASGLLKGTNTIQSKWAYKIPFACQWFLPVIILSLLFYCPTPPYWLARKGRIADAEKSLISLSTKGVNTKAALANVQETLRLEQKLGSGGNFNFADCFRGSNLRRLIISVMVYQLQPLGGNILFINYAVYFFENAGLNSSDAFSMNIGLTCLGFTATVLSWPLMSYAGRRTILVVGSAVLTLIVLLIGILDVVPHHTTGPIWAQCSLMVIANFVYDLSTGPICFVLLCEISAARVRGATIAIANIMVSVSSIIFAVAIPYALNADQGNWRGKVGFLFAGLGVVCTAWCFFCLPESKGRTFEELDIMFERKIPSRQFKNYEILGAVGAEAEFEGTV